MNDYWKNYWEHDEITKRENLQAQVGRTVNKKPIKKSSWESTLKFISSHIDLRQTDEVLDLCGGNGLIAVPFSKQCRKVTLVDISPELIKRVDTDRHKNIVVMKSDVRTLSLAYKSADKAILYFALQHFDERETIILFKKVYNWLKDRGIFYIGDIPDMEKIWLFCNTSEREMAYFKSIQNQEPIIGTWFTKEFLKRAARYSNYSSAKIIKQPANQINSHYRFDLILQK